MNKIREYLREYYIKEFNLSYQLALMTFVGLLIWINYDFNLMGNFIYKDSLIKYRFLIYFALYGFTFGSAYLLLAIFKKDFSFLKQRKFWLLFFLGVGVFSLRVSAYKHNNIIGNLFSDDLYQWAVKTFDNLVELILIMAPLWLYWYMYDRMKEPFYGFSLKNYDTKPYLYMLALMVPLIALASLQKDFLNTYPTSGDIDNIDIHTTKGKCLYAVYELFYGMDFISIEFFFRGFLIFTFGRIVGPAAILPMCAFYVVIHFGKPMGETISSFFGGWLLGIISYYSRSIAGGIIVHVGIAWLMEIGALLKKIYS